MLRRVFRVDIGCRHSLRKSSWAGACVLVSAFFAPELLAQGAPTPAGTQIDTWAEATYLGPNGNTFSVSSDTLSVFVGQVAGVDVDPPRSSIGDPGDTIVFPHVLTNLGNGGDSFVLSVTSPAGWPAVVHDDANANGALDAGELPLSGPLPLAQGEVYAILVVVQVPPLATLRGTSDTLAVVATSQHDGSESDALDDVLEIRDTGILVSLAKTVDQPSATIGDVLTYTVVYTAAGPGGATNFQIMDLVPNGTSYVPGSMRLDGALLTDAAGDDAGVFDLTSNRVTFLVGDIAGGDSGTATFQVRVDG